VQPFVARIWMKREHVVEGPRGVRHHGAKLEATENPTAAANPFVREENR
jgi:hypothetical protein